MHCERSIKSAENLASPDAGFQTRENVSACNDGATPPQRALAPVRTPNFANSTTAGRATALMFCIRARLQSGRKRLKELEF
jgi:hypothetical protein